MFKLAVFVACLAHVYAQQAAVVYLSDPSGVSGVKGNVTFTVIEKGIQITGTVTGLKTGKHGFHVHQLGHIAPGCTGTGGHFNPHNKTHGAPTDAIRHVGDLGNIDASANGEATIDFSDNVIALTGEHGIIGRAVVVHAGEDDLGKGGNADSLVTGNAGGRVACGVIGILEESSGAANIFSSLSLIIMGIVLTLVKSMLKCMFN